MDNISQQPPAVNATTTTESSECFCEECLRFRSSSTAIDLPVATDTTRPPRYPKKRYIQISKADFEQALREKGLTDLQEVEPSWTGSKWTGFGYECTYIAHFDGVPGYLKIWSGISPETQKSGPRGRNAIHIQFKRRKEEIAHRQVNRLPLWKENLSKALEHIIEKAREANNPTSINGKEPQSDYVRF